MSGKNTKRGFHGWHESDDYFALFIDGTESFKLAKSIYAPLLGDYYAGITWQGTPTRNEYDDIVGPNLLFSTADVIYSVNSIGGYGSEIVISGGNVDTRTLPTSYNSVSGGYVQIYGGSCVSTTGDLAATGWGGDVFIAGGATGATSMSFGGGSVGIYGGASQGGRGGNVSLIGGQGGGGVALAGGLGINTAGGSLTFVSGSAAGQIGGSPVSKNSGGMSFTIGEPSITFYGGTGGSAGNYTFTGQSATNTAGSGTGFTVTLGRGGSQGGAAGAFAVTTGNGGSTSGNSGRVDLATGTVTLGTVGPVMLRPGGIMRFSADLNGIKFVETNVTSITTAGAPLTLTGSLSGTHLNNVGAAGKCFYTLAGSVGWNFGATVISTQGIRFTAPVNHVIVDATIEPTVISTVGSGYIESTKYGSHIWLTYVSSGLYVVTKRTGVWSIV